MRGNTFSTYRILLAVRFVNLISYIASTVGREDGVANNARHHLVYRSRAPRRVRNPARDEGQLRAVARRRPETQKDTSRTLPKNEATAASPKH